MRIRFTFDLAKSLHAMARLISKLGPMDKVKLMKLLYLADRAHFIKYGISITGDRLVAMPYGPVPSQSLDAINGDSMDDEVFRVLHVDNRTVDLAQRPACDGPLSAAELATLDRVAAEHGHKGTWPLVHETHRLPEYEEAYVEGTSSTIPFERIAKHSGDENRFRHHRAVVSTAVGRLLPCPFPDDSDL